MRTALYFHPSFLCHDTGPNHPECSARLQSIMKRLNDPIYDALDRLEAPEATVEQLRRVHSESHIRKILGSIPDQGRKFIDPDTVVSSGTREASLRASGAAVAAVEGVCRKKIVNAFCAIRPPGHHAEPERSMGFCLFNSVAIGAAHAKEVFGMDRVAIVDIDVHHGNGTQAWVEDKKNFFYTSIHQSPLYPGTGFVSDRGCGNVLNIPVSPGATSKDYYQAVDEILIPELQHFRPEIIMVSAGFDAHTLDPLANVELQDTDYGWITRRLTELAANYCDNRLVSVLEGGYNLDALADSAAAHVMALMDVSGSVDESLLTV